MSFFSFVVVCTLPETNSSPLKMDGWNTTFLLGRPIFRGYVSFREGSVFVFFSARRRPLTLWKLENNICIFSRTVGMTCFSPSLENQLLLI